MSQNIVLPVHNQSKSYYKVFRVVKWSFIITQIILLLLSITLFFSSLVLYYTSDATNEQNHITRRESQRLLLFFCSLANFGTILSSIGIYGSLTNDKIIICAYASLVVIVMFAVIVFVGNIYEVCLLWALFVFASIYAFLTSKYEDKVYDVRTGNV